MKENDCISRKRAIERLKLNLPISQGADNSRDRHRYMQALADIQAIRELPSVTPQLSSELEKNSQKLEKDFGELDCISREQAIEGVWEIELAGLDNKKVVDMLKALPSVTPQEPRKGHWISTETKGVRYAFWCRYKCSLCGGLSDCTNFCPNCGAKMVEPQESEDKA